jgi:gamma-glutamyl-gamma-aminobutyrate hydrolase PuuD
VSSKLKVAIVHSNGQYDKMFRDMGWELVTTIEEADLVQFTGGEDVTPSYYGEEDHRFTGNNPYRDKNEQNIFKLCRELNKPMAGICRGGQFLNVMCGGKLFQHVDGHAIGGTHEAVDVETGAVVDVTSTHHQMMRVGADGVLLAYAGQSTFREHMVGKGQVANVPRSDGDQDVEAVFYPASLALCFQPHPEYGYSDCRDYYFNLISRHLGL